MDLDTVFVGDRLKPIVNVVQHLAVDLQRLYYLLVRVLQRYLSQVHRDLAPPRILTPPMGRAEEHNKFRSCSTRFRSMHRLYTISTS